MKPEDRKKPRRATKEIPIVAYEKSDIPDLVEELTDVISKVEWKYTSEYREQLIIRDQGLVSFLLQSGLRITEALSVSVGQVVEQPKKFLVFNVPTLKHGKLRQQITIPKDGSLGKVTVFFDKWFRYLTETLEVSKDSPLFLSGSNFGFVTGKSLSRYRAHRIMKVTVNRFPHWARAVYENIYGHIVYENNPYKLQKEMGVNRLESVLPYVQSEIEKDKAKLYLL